MVVNLGDQKNISRNCNGGKGVCTLVIEQHQQQPQHKPARRLKKMEYLGREWILWKWRKCMNLMIKWELIDEEEEKNGRK